MMPASPMHAYGLALLAWMAPDPIRDGDARFRSRGPRPATTTAISRTTFTLFLLLAPAVTTAQTAASIATSPLPRSHTGVTEVVSVPCRFDPLTFNVPPFFYVPDSVYGWKEGIILLESNCGRYWIHIEGEVAGAGILERDVGYIGVNQAGTPSLRLPHIELSNHNTNSSVTKTRRYILDFCPRDEIEYSFQCGPSTVDPAERSTLTVNWLPNRPDLIVRSPAVDKNNLAAGETFTFSASVHNQGHNEALSVTLEYYQSSDPLISQDDDTHLGSDYVGTLGQSNRSNHSTVLTAPASAGVHYYGACALTTTYEDDLFNNCSTGVRVVVSNLAPDLVVDPLRASVASPAPEAAFRLFTTVRNQGTAAAEQTTLGFYRSIDTAVFPANDEIVGTADVYPLYRSEDQDRFLHTTAPSNAGTYYYYACVTPVAGEVDTANNCSSPSLQIVVNGAGPSFTDDPIAAGSTIVKAVHFQELRNAIDALRLRRGLPRYDWVDRTLRRGITRIRAVHLTQMRAALDDVYASSGRSRPSYTDTIRAGETPIKARHINELRRAVLRYVQPQPGGCTSVNLTPESESLPWFGSEGEALEIAVTASPASCQWTARSNAEFITIVSGATGRGSGRVRYMVGVNNGCSRSGTLTIANRTFIVRQGSDFC